jgi:hypothetical protein
MDLMERPCTRRIPERPEAFPCRGRMAVVFLIYDSFENANMAWVEMVRRRRRKIS